MFQIVYSKNAAKFLRKQDRPTRERIMLAISKLPNNGDIKRLQGAEGFRLRVGNFRVLFDVNGLIIDIIDIGNRGQIYKGVRIKMSDVKERILGAVTIMNEADAQKVWELIQAAFSLANAELVEPTAEELLILHKYHSGDPDYQPDVTQDELMKELLA